MKINTEDNKQKMQEAIEAYQRQIQALEIMLPIAKQWTGKDITQRMITAMQKELDKAIPSDGQYSKVSVRIDKNGDLFPYKRMTIYDNRNNYDNRSFDVYWSDNAYSNEVRTPESEIIKMIQYKKDHIDQVQDGIKKLAAVEAKYNTMVEAIKDYNDSIDGFSYLLDVPRYSEFGSR